MGLKMREIGFQRTYIFKIFRGSMPPDTPRKVRLWRTITFLITYEHPLENLSYAPAYQIDKHNKEKVIQTIACVFRAIECMVCRCESAEVGLKFRVKMAASVASSKFAHFPIIARYLKKPTLSTNCPTKVQSLSEIDFLRFAAIFGICLINADIRS